MTINMQLHCSTNYARCVLPLHYFSQLAVATRSYVVGISVNYHTSFIHNVMPN